MDKNRVVRERQMDIGMLIGEGRRQSAPNSKYTLVQRLRLRKG